MKDPVDSRNIRPRVGTPLWLHMTAVIVSGCAVFALIMLHATGLPEIAQRPEFWVLLGLMLVCEFKPMTRGGAAPEFPSLSAALGFAALLAWGVAAAVLLRLVSGLAEQVARQRAPQRTAFNMAQDTLSLAAAGAVLAGLGVRADPLRVVAPNGGNIPAILVAAVVLFAVSFVLVGVAVALSERVPVVDRLRRDLAALTFSNAALLSTGPLIALLLAVSASGWPLALLGLPVLAIYRNAVIMHQRDHQVHHDDLTGLYNRTLLINRAGEALVSAGRSATKSALLMLDLDRFKEVNDTLGHAVGDRMLRIVGHRLTHSVRPGDVVARMGGDEFAVLLPSVKEPSAAREVASRLRAGLAEPIRLDGVSFNIEASVGIGVFPDDGVSTEQLLQHADTALYLAKERRSGVERYLADADRNSPTRLALIGDMRRALDRRELLLHYLPKVLLCDGRVVGIEALLRWQHPERGLLGPSEFIPVIRQSYMMREVTSRVIELALEQTALWWRAGLPVPVSVNIAARDLLDTGLADTINQGLLEHGLPPEALLLEIDERLLTSDPCRAAATAETLAQLSVPLSLDNFGTGYSSLVRLKRMPVSEVKIDQSFISQMLVSSEDQVIVQSIVDLASALGIGSVAEGVETADTAEALRGMGCVAAQGWHFSRPLNAASASTWLAEHFESPSASSPSATSLRHRATEKQLSPFGPAELGSESGSRVRRWPAPAPARMPAASAALPTRSPTVASETEVDRDGVPGQVEYAGHLAVADGPRGPGARHEQTRCDVPTRMSSVSIGRDEVAHLARLSRLALSDDELDHLADQLSEIISAVARVQEVTAEAIPAMTHATGVVNVFREDVLTPCLPAETVLSQAPAAEHGRFRVPRILAED